MSFFSSSMLIIDAIFIVGLLFIILEYFISKKKIILKHSLSSLTPFQAILTGFMQALAVIPGVSRSGIVMFYLMGQGYKRDEAATYSFLLAVPTILAASTYDLLKMRSLIGPSVQYLPSSCRIRYLIHGRLCGYEVVYRILETKFTCVFWNIPNRISNNTFICFLMDNKVSWTDTFRKNRLFLAFREYPPHKFPPVAIIPFENPDMYDAAFLFLLSEVKSQFICIWKISRCFYSIIKPKIWSPCGCNDT